MMQQDPYAGIARPATQADPYAGIAGPDQQAQPQRRAQTRQQQRQQPGAPQVATPAPAPEPQIDRQGYNPTLDAAIAGDDPPPVIRQKLINSGMNPAEVERIMGDLTGSVRPQAGDVAYIPQGSVGPDDTPNSLALQGYRFDPQRQSWVIDTQVDAPAPLERTTTAGYEEALRQERENQDRLSRFGGGYSDPSFTDQFTAPINDEIAAGIGFASQGLGNILRQIQGRDIEVSAADRAGAMRDLAREGQDRFTRDHPFQAATGQILGGAAIGPAAGPAWGFAVRGAAPATMGLLGRITQGGAMGGAYGVADGEGVGGRALGGLLGAAGGAATVGALEGVGAMARGASTRLHDMANPSLLPRSERRVAGAMERAMLRDNLTPDELLARLPGRPEGQLPFEAGGDNMAGLAEVLAQTPGRGRTSVLDAIEARSAGVNDRLTSRLGETFGAEGNYFQVIKDRIAQRGAQAQEGMAQIGQVVVPLDDASVRALRSGLSSRAVRDAALEATADLNDGASAAANRLFGLGDQVLDNPGAAQITVREAQDISYALKEAASRAYRAGFNSRGEALQTLSTAIRQNARTQVPGYDDWLRQFGDASESIDALRAGQSVFQAATERNSRSAAELARQWPEWSEAARDNFRRGIGEAIMSRVREQGGVTAMRRLLRSQEFGDRVRIAFPSDQAFDDFMRAAQAEVQMANTASRVAGNSATDRRAAARADLTQQSGVDPLDVVDFAGDVTSPLAMTGKGLRLLLKQVPRRDRSILGDEQLNGLLGEALTDETTMRSLLQDLQRARQNRATGRSRVSGVGLLAIPGAGAAGQNRARGLLTQ